VLPRRNKPEPCTDGSTSKAAVISRNSSNARPSQRIARSPLLSLLPFLKCASSKELRIPLHSCSWAAHFLNGSLADPGMATSNPSSKRAYTGRQSTDYSNKTTRGKRKPTCSKKINSHELKAIFIAPVFVLYFRDCMHAYYSVSSSCSHLQLSFPVSAFASGKLNCRCEHDDETE